MLLVVVVVVVVVVVLLVVEVELGASSGKDAATTNGMQAANKKAQKRPSISVEPFGWCCA